jgi:hypothetical protein
MFVKAAPAMTQRAGNERGQKDDMAIGTITLVVVFIREIYSNSYFPRGRRKQAQSPNEVLLLPSLLRVVLPNCGRELK